MTVALNYGEINWNSEKVLNIKSFISKYNWKGINYPKKIDDWQTLEKNYSKVALHILHIKQKEILPAFISKHN